LEECSPYLREYLLVECKRVLFPKYSVAFTFMSVSGGTLEKIHTKFCKEADYNHGDTLGIFNSAKCVIDVRF
jgi:hypothetical protein